MWRVFYKKLKRRIQPSSGKGFVSFLTEAAGKDDQGLFQMLGASSDGLSDADVDERLKKYGPNAVVYEKAPAWPIQLLSAFLNPFTFILLVIAGISFFVDDVLAAPDEKDSSTVVVILVMVVFSGLLRFIQEYRSSKAAEQLKKMVKTFATVLRKEQGVGEVPIEALVPGDLIKLAAGDMVPADCRLVICKDLFVSESMLTGEALPVEKKKGPVADAATKSPLSIENLCFMGTNVVSGSATAVVLATGGNSYFGSISHDITGQRPETAFDKGVNKVSYLLIRFMLVMVPVIFLVNGLVKGVWTEALLFAIAVAVGLIPEMLPMIVTANLAKGAVNMSKKKVIVKRLNAIQNVGAMDILCTDKTGTITLNKIVLEKHLNVMAVDDDEVLKWAYLNSYYQTGLKNLLDQAVLEHTEVQKMMHVGESYEKVDEIPFDFDRRRMSVILRQPDGKQLLICKGAAEEILSLSTTAFDPGEDKSLHIEEDETVPLDDAQRSRILKVKDRMNEEGLRVLFIGIREFDANHPINYSVQDEQNLTLAGSIGFLDPPKPSAAPSIASLHDLGVDVKVITGDNEVIARKICRDVNIAVNHILLGDEMDRLSDEALQEQIKDVAVFAKVNPRQKLRIVQALRQQGHTVGFMGDGINDAAAIKEADVGISVDTAVDIAKESADIILLENDLMVLKEAVLSGRVTFGNIVKYIKMAASSNFGNMFSMLGASALLPFLPMLPLQILTQNLLYDFSQSAIPWDNMDEDFLIKPKKWQADGIQRFMVWIGPISSLFDYATFAVMFFVFKANTPEHQSLFQTGWFVEGLLSQTLIVHMIRTRKIPFVQSWASAPLVAVTSTIMLMGIIIPFTSLAGALKMQSLPLSYFPWLIIILTAYCLLTQMVKNWYIKKYKEWL